MIYQPLSLLRVQGWGLGHPPKVLWLSPYSHAALNPHTLPTYSTILMNIWL